jgi:hypothetical protein
VRDGGTCERTRNACLADILATDEQELDAQTALRGGVQLAEVAANGADAARNDGRRRHKQRTRVERKRAQVGQSVKRGGQRDEIGGGEIEVFERGTARELGRNAKNPIASQIELLERGTECDFARNRRSMHCAPQ